MAIGVKCRQTRGKIQTVETTQTLFTNVDLRPIRSGVQWASFELCSNKRTESRCIFLCLEQSKMLIIPPNLDSVLLSLHNSKLAYSGSSRASKGPCKRSQHCWANIVVSCFAMLVDVCKRSQQVTTCWVFSENAKVDFLFACMCGYVACSARAPAQHC